MPSTYDFTAGDTGSKIRVEFINAATGRKLVPFSGLYTASIWVKPFGGSATKRTMTVLTGSDDGFAEYQFLGTDLVVGDLTVQAEAALTADATIISQLGITTYHVGPKL